MINFISTANTLFYCNINFYTEPNMFWFINCWVLYVNFYYYRNVCFWWKYTWFMDMKHPANTNIDKTAYRKLQYHTVVMIWTCIQGITVWISGYFSGFSQSCQWRGTLQLHSATRVHTIHYHFPTSAMKFSNRRINQQTHFVSSTIKRQATLKQ